MISLMHCAVSVFAILQVHQKPFLNVFKSEMINEKPLNQICNEGHPSPLFKKDASNFIGKGWIFLFATPDFLLQKHTPRVHLETSVISTVGHGEANGEKPFAPVGTSGARAFQAYSTAPTDTWAFLVVEGYDERRRASLVIFSLTQHYHPQTLNWLRSQLEVQWYSSVVELVKATMTFWTHVAFLLQSIRSQISKTFPRSVFWNVSPRAPQHPFTTTPINR